MHRKFAVSLASLDGNHQWLDKAPAYPRKPNERPGNLPRASWPSGTYRKPEGYASAAGFPLFSDVAVSGFVSPRRGLFLKLFRGR